jgi:hypothetical protein
VILQVLTSILHFTLQYDIGCGMLSVGKLYAKYLQCEYSRWFWRQVDAYMYADYCSVSLSIALRRQSSPFG